MTFALYVVLLSFLDVCAMLAARFYHEKKKTYLMWVSMLFFALSAFVYVQMLEFTVTAIVNIIYIGFSSVALAVSCYFIFGEKINLGQAAGIAMVFIGVSLLG